VTANLGADGPYAITITSQGKPQTADGAVQCPVTAIKITDRNGRTILDHVKNLTDQWAGGESGVAYALTSVMPPYQQLFVTSLAMGASDGAIELDVLDFSSGAARRLAKFSNGSVGDLRWHVNGEALVIKGGLYPSENPEFTREQVAAMDGATMRADIKQESVTIHFDPKTGEPTTTATGLQRAFFDELIGRAEAGTAAEPPAPPPVARIEDVPTCARFLTSLRTGDTAPYIEYAAGIYVRLDAAREAVGRRPVGLPLFGWQGSVKFWARLCGSMEDQPFYNVVLAGYNVGVAMQSVGR
jgi:hypothetical protein